MRRALALALRGKGGVSPNPCVGCVIVKNNKIIGEGYHRQIGGPHAEVLALKKAGRKALGAVAYVTLEPCSHWGKTPPCAPLLVKAGIKEVYVSMKDPNPKVSGKGLRQLKKSRIKTHVGIEADSSKALNPSYLKWIKTKTPYVILKSAMTLDGKISSVTGKSNWISNTLSRRLVHKLRAESDGILIGASTAEMDNPSLTSHGFGRNPIRILLDPNLRSRTSLKIFRDHQAPTIVLTSTHSSKQKIKSLQKKGVLVTQFKLKKGKFNLKEILKYLGKMNVSQLLVEGGGETVWSFVKNRLVDEFFYFIAPKWLGGSQAKTPIGGQGFKDLSQAVPLHLFSVNRIGGDILVRGRP